MPSRQSAWVLTPEGQVAFSSEPRRFLPPSLESALAAREGARITTSEGVARVFFEHGGDRRVVVLSRPCESLQALSPRQIEVAEYAAVGATCNEIARALEISTNTVRHHIRNAYNLLGVGSRVELARALSLIE